MKRLEIMGLDGIGEVERGNSIGRLIHDSCLRLGIDLAAGDIVVIAQKVVSKAEGQVVRLEDIHPSPRAEELSRELAKDPRLVELILSESRRVVKTGRGTIIVETHHGFICANAGVDLSNVGVGLVALLPRDPDRSAARVREEIRVLCGVAPGVVISDSFGRPWRLGTTDVALGVAGIEPLKDYRGETDPYGYELRASLTALGDEVASAASLAMGKKNQIPVVLIRGCDVGQGSGSGQGLLRPKAHDLFRGL